MNILRTELPGVIALEPKVFGDARGFFMESYNQRQFDDLGLPTHFVQDNHSRSQQGVLRGIHYQLRHPQGKLVRVVNGTVFDVAVDLRENSATFGRWVGMELSSENQRMLWIPPGFGHGFLVLSAVADFLYKTTDFYAPEYERCLKWDDPDVAIQWPLAAQPLVSAKDQAGQSLAEIKVGSLPDKPQLLGAGLRGLFSGRVIPAQGYAGVA